MSESGKERSRSIAEQHARRLLFLVGVAFIVSVVLGLFLRNNTLISVLLPPLILVPIMFGYKRFCLEDLGLPPEDTGDSVYYLGFLFTATSLAAGLLVIGYLLQQTDGRAGGDVVISLLPSFATALITTIVGLCIRVTLSQQVTDPAHVETELRDELHRAAAGLKHQTDLATDQFARLVVILQQKTVEVDREFNSFATALQAAFRGGSLQRPAEQLQESAEALRSVSDSLSHASLHFGEELKPALGTLTDAAVKWERSSDEHASAIQAQADAMQSQAISLDRLSDKVHAVRAGGAAHDAWSLWRRVALGVGMALAAAALLASAFLGWGLGLAWTRLFG